MMKEVVVACVLLIISTLKLHFKNSFNTVVYHNIKEHIILLLQKLSLLLSFLLSLRTTLYDSIYIIYYGKERLTNYNLKYFMQLKKQKIFISLISLQENSLYQDIIINYDILKSILDKFSLEEILLRVILMNQDSENVKDMEQILILAMMKIVYILLLELLE